MGSRLELHSLLTSIPGVKAAYFQAPPNVQLTYPCIMYELSQMNRKDADNVPYKITKAYMLTIIDKNPDSTIIDAVAALPMCAFNRAFTVDNLYHTVFTLYF